MLAVLTPSVPLVMLQVAKPLLPALVELIVWLLEHAEIAPMMLIVRPMMVEVLPETLFAIQHLVYALILPLAVKTQIVQLDLIV